MTIDDYIATCVKDPQAVAQTTLEIRRRTYDRFVRVQRESEAQAVEQGYFLYFQDGILFGGKTIVGSTDRLQMDTETERHKSTYIGDFHVHPYREKVGPKAGVGPSLVDIKDWLDYRPTHFSIEVNFNFAGKTLYLIVVRQDSLTIDDLKSMKPPLGPADYQKANAWAKTKQPDLESRVSEFQIAYDKDHSTGVQTERATWDSIPGYATTFSSLNRDMNVKIANQLRYELYAYDADSTLGNDNKSNGNRVAARISADRVRGPVPIFIPQSKGAVCIRCGAVHSWTPSLKNHWHRCRKCQAINCPSCGKILNRPASFTRERTCVRNECGGRTELI